MLSDAAESITKTAKAVEVLKKIGAYADVEKAKDSKAIRRGKGARRGGTQSRRSKRRPSSSSSSSRPRHAVCAGKMRNRRYTLRKGPLVVYGSNNGIAKAFRNLPGVEVASVDSLNLLQVRGCGGGSEEAGAGRRTHRWMIIEAAALHTARSGGGLGKLAQRCFDNSGRGGTQRRVGKLWHGGVLTHVAAR